MDEDESGNEAHLSKDEARAGSRTKANRNALVWGLILVLCAFVAIVGIGYLRTDRTGADEVNGGNATANATDR